MPAESPILASRILIVDDEPANIKLLEKTLKSAGFSNIKSERNSKKFSAVYKEFQPDLLLLDLRMPAPDGFQIMEEISGYEEQDRAPIMVLTAESESHIRLRALNQGALDFLSKPFDYSEVILRVKNILTLKQRFFGQQKSREESNENIARETSRKTHDVDLDIIQSLCRANRIRFKDTSDNYLRVCHYAYLLGKKIGLDEKHCKQIKIASSTYDIGKIGVPQSILTKSGKLTPDEWEIMMTHTTLGAELLSGSDTPLMKMAQTIALEHHENWDGSGYPKGIKGEAIQLEARIISICDAFDSMTSERVYRPRMSFEEAVTLIKIKSGVQFDPRLVAAFEQEVPRFTQIKNECRGDNDNDDASLKLDYVFDSSSIKKLKETLPILLDSHDDDKLLIVDDVQTMRSAYKMIARQLGFAYENIIEASSGLMALKKMDAHEFDLVITDLYMPVMTGLEMIQKIRKNLKYEKLPIIVVSEENRKEEIIKIINSGASQYLLKPFNGYQLEQKINQALFAMKRASH